jgi:hypothetical protein
LASKGGGYPPPKISRGGPPKRWIVMTWVIPYPAYMVEIA